MVGARDEEFVRSPLLVALVPDLPGGCAAVAADDDEEGRRAWGSQGVKGVVAVGRIQVGHHGYRIRNQGRSR